VTCVRLHALAGSVQPYHYVVKKEIRAAETHLASSASESAHLAFEALSRLSTELQERGFMLTSATILLSSARPLPALEEILASHPLIHTAEGEFFRKVFRAAFEKMEIPVSGIRTRDLDECALKAFGKAAFVIQKRIDAMGRSLGAPWTKDEKTAALMAAIVLSGDQMKGHAAHSSGA